MQNIFDLRENFNLPSALISIPFICEIGIKLNSGPDYDDLMKDLQSQFTIAISHKQATEYVQGTEETSIKEIGYILMDKEKAPEDKNKRSGDKDTRDDITEDIKVRMLFLMIS